MIKKKIIFFASFCIIISVFYQLKSQNLKFGIFDTTHLEIYRYQSFNEILKSVGFDIEYNSVAKILDSDIKELNLDSYDAILFLIDIEFLKGILNSLACQKIFRIINKFGKKTNKLIGFAFPTIGQKIHNKILLFSPFFKSVGLNINPFSFEIDKIPDNFDINSINLDQLNNSLKNFFNFTRNFLDQPLEARSFLYHKTLACPTKINFAIKYPTYTNHYLAILPIKHGCPLRLAPTLPYGIYFYNPIIKNQIFITSNSLLSFSSACESFHICPTNFNLRYKIHNLIQEMMWELKILMITKKNNELNFDYIKQNKKPKLPIFLSNLEKNSESKPKNKKSIKIAWMEIKIFEKNDQESIKQQYQLINDILKTGNDTYLWITLNPNMYFSPIAKHTSEINTYLNSISKFTNLLKTKSQQLNTIPPKILLGYEITNNIYEPNLPTNYAVDLYTNKYLDLPSPLDENFWNNEIKKPLNFFLEKWKNPNISNNIKIVGIVLDLEMYCRKISGSFLDTIGFSSLCRNKYKTIKKITKNISINNLITTKSIQNYYDFLKTEAINLGNNLKNFFNEKIKNCMIICYAPNISTDWFYKAFYQGLSDKKNPIELLTFNSIFYSHKDWLIKNNIYANHSSVLMLSKIKNESDFLWIDHILKYHDGIWLNKFSRFSEKKHNDWMAIEQSPINEKEKNKFLEYLKNK
ncbi:hypothetical protein GF322_03605 [Candidatus Dependentiae bacterium]|nr:hypothetical protein [Candidatus Dependentiae bacterium]